MIIIHTDSASFDAKAYYEQLITTTTLTGLLKRENELSAGLSTLFGFLPYVYIAYLSDFVSLVLEIRQLDGERQSLVYNHHHELIAASDTIRAVGRVICRGKGGEESHTYSLHR